ncbi:hypothetical protein D9611_001521 [Ephemerocybe angulata]|uniref:NAD(P)-binding protein n=1 Tax=Ephemerocybe angulata TaxID=980116 RepID=A0A8H5FMC9_9AGAR|nr:hypothetical protein D9611_001521 [Tulosesus angulatus]
MPPAIVRNFIDQAYPPKARFSTSDIPDLTGEVAIVTGANTGVGKVTAKELLSHNAKVYFAARDKTRAEQAIEELKEETGKEGIFLQLDLSDLHSVKRAVEEFQKQETQLHILFNNAGVMEPPIEQLTKQGYDLQFGTNVLGHFYLTKLLLPSLLAAKALNGKAGRVIHTSSLSATFANTLEFNTFIDGPARRKLGKRPLYNQSKLGNVVISNEFARRYGEQGLISAAVNPGNLKSDLQRHVGRVPKAIMTFLFLHPIEFGALTQLWAGTTEEGSNMNGKYLIPWARHGPPPPASLNEELGKELWDWLEKQVESV